MMHLAAAGEQTHIADTYEVTVGLPLTLCLFILLQAFQNCHAPYQVPDAYQDMYPGLPRGKSQRCYNAMATAMDESVGVIVDALKQSQLYQNTIIIWTSDKSVFPYTPLVIWALCSSSVSACVCVIHSMTHCAVVQWRAS